MKNFVKLALLGLAGVKALVDDQCVLWVTAYSAATDCTGTKAYQLYNLTTNKCWKQSANISTKITECTESSVKYTYYPTAGDCTGNTFNVATTPVREGINHDLTVPANKAKICTNISGQVWSATYSVVNAPSMNNAQADANKALLATHTNTLATLATKAENTATNALTVTNKNEIAGVKTSLANYAATTTVTALDTKVTGLDTTLKANGPKIIAVTSKADALKTKQDADALRITNAEAQAKELDAKVVKLVAHIEAQTKKILELEKSSATKVEVAKVVTDIEAQTKKIGELAKSNDTKVSWCLLFICW